MQWHLIIKIVESSSDTTGLDVECTQNEKELLDYVLEKYRQGVFELFNIIASKLDQIHGQAGYGEKVIKDCLEEFHSDRRKTKAKARSLKVKLK